jgi:hypothetical protein
LGLNHATETSPLFHSLPQLFACHHLLRVYPARLGFGGETMLGMAFNEPSPAG